jgi:hypothetical protein
VFVLERWWRWWRWSKLGKLIGSSLLEVAVLRIARFGTYYSACIFLAHRSRERDAVRGE